MASALAITILCACAPGPGQAPTAGLRSLAAAGLSGEAWARLERGMDPSLLALARRHDPASRSPDLWDRPEGWENLDLRRPPDLGFGDLAGASAEELNALRPFSGAPIRPMRPFVLRAGTEDRARALRCLSQAIYYEAGREPAAGRAAVAQVVLNRLRHPAYPKSVCGVVYQGSARATGCQFTFTCDGALRWAPEPGRWREAEAVARRALAGFVDRQVGSATHYHAAYVAPYWAPTLVKMTRVGQHIFYRWTGPWGEPAAFRGRYAGGEAVLTPAVLEGDDPRTGGLLAPQRQGIPAERRITLAVAGEVRTYDVADPAAEGGRRTRVRGAIQAPRRQPTPEEVKAINETLARMEKAMDAQSPARPADPRADAGAAPGAETAS